jgi:hypothetical protein
LIAPEALGCRGKNIVLKLKLTMKIVLNLNVLSGNGVGEIHLKDKKKKRFFRVDGTKNFLTSFFHSS